MEITREQFGTGLKVFFSCGGAKPDDATLEIWWQMLKDLHPGDYINSIQEICKQNEKPLAIINFIGEVRERALKNKRSRQSAESRDEFLLPPPDMIPREELKEKVRGLIETFKEVEK